MTSATDPFATHRILLRAALQSALDAETYGYAAALQSQMTVSAQDEGVLLPGLLCLATAEAIGGFAVVAQAPAVSLVLLGAMSRVFEGIASEGASDLEREWGMPRALNAGDGFYALAYSNLISGTSSMKPESRLEAIGLLDIACHHLSLEINAGATKSSALLSAAASLGALLAGADGATVSQMVEFGRDISPARLQALPDTARSALVAASAYITNRSRR